MNSINYNQNKGEKKGVFMKNIVKFSFLVLMTSLFISCATQQQTKKIDKEGTQKVEKEETKPSEEEKTEKSEEDKTETSNEEKTMNPEDDKTKDSSEMMTLKVYFSDSKDNPDFADCKKVRAVERKVPKTQGVARAALNELFKGPTEAEKNDKLSSFFTNDSKDILKNITIKDGNAYVDLDKWVIQNLGGATTSCGGAGFSAQIETTLKQFPTVKKVFYSIDGNTTEFYSWQQMDCPKELKDCDSSKL